MPCTACMGEPACGCKCDRPPSSTSQWGWGWIRSGAFETKIGGDVAFDGVFLLHVCLIFVWLWVWFVSGNASFCILFLWRWNRKNQSSQWNCFPSCLLSTCLFRISPASYSHWPHFDLCDLCWCFIKFPRISVLKSHFAQIWFYNLWCFIEFSLLVTYAQKLHFTFCSSIRLLLVWVFKVLLDDVENSQRLHFR